MVVAASDPLRQCRNVFSSLVEQGEMTGRLPFCRCLIVERVRREAKGGAACVLLLRSRWLLTLDHVFVCATPADPSTFAPSAASPVDSPPSLRSLSSLRHEHEDHDEHGAAGTQQRRRCRRCRSAQRYAETGQRTGAANRAAADRCSHRPLRTESAAYRSLESRCAHGCDVMSPLRAAVPARAISQLDASDRSELSADSARGHGSSPRLPHPPVTATLESRRLSKRRLLICVCMHCRCCTLLR